MFGRIKTYIHESQQEFRRVNWPTRQETIKLTIVVIGISLTVAAFLGILDFIFTYLLKAFLL